MTRIEHTVIEIIDKKIEHLQNAIQYIDAAQEDGLLKTSIKISKIIQALEKRKKSLQNDLEDKS